ncbi:MAG: hypothetical protein GY820_01780 [Gammaproteobacteria bacterium]|nr:hypothetical protein [Gammaproteobacteria bacterium]
MVKELLSGKVVSHIPVVRKLPIAREKKARRKQSCALRRNSSAGRKVFMFMFRGRLSKKVDLMIRKT